MVLRDLCAKFLQNFGPENQNIFPDAISEGFLPSSLAARILTFYCRAVSEERRTGVGQWFSATCLSDFITYFGLLAKNLE